MKIAITGGIACGKSLLSKILTELGCEILDADDVVHGLEAPGGAAVEPILERFASVADGDSPCHFVNRKKLASIVFNDPTARKDLENILFPLVRRQLLSFVTQHLTPDTQHPIPNTQPPTPETQHLTPDTQHPKICVIPLLFESHWEKDYDIIIVLSSSEEKQIERMMVTRGYTREHAKARLAAQLPIEEKVRRADYVIVNDSTKENLRIEAGRLLAWLKERKPYEH